MWALDGKAKVPDRPVINEGDGLARQLELRVDGVACGTLQCQRVALRDLGLHLSPSWPVIYDVDLLTGSWAVSYQARIICVPKMVDAVGGVIECKCAY